MFDKGELISKGHFGVFKSTKKQTNFFEDFCPNFLKRGRIKKVKELYYTN